MASPLEKIQCIACAEDREKALAEIERLKDAEPNTEEANERDALITMISAWESKGKPQYRWP